MPTCRASHLRSSLASAGRVRSIAGRRGAALPLNGVRLARQASTTHSPPEDGSFRNKTKTILHKVDSFLPRVLPVEKRIFESETVSFWQELLDGAYKELNSPSKKGPARVVVYGCFENSGTKDLVTALLEEPFAPHSRNEAIRERKGADEENPFYLSHGFTQTGEANRLRVPCTWLQQFNVPVEITELPTSRSASSTTLRSLFSADVPIIAYNPITCTLFPGLSDEELPLSHANAILVVTAAPNSGTGNATFTLNLPSRLKVLYIDPTRAINAIQALSAGPTSSAVERYQNDFIGSGIADLTSAIAEKLSTTAAENAADLQAASAMELMRMCLLRCWRTLECATYDAEEVESEVAYLKDAVAELEVRIGGEVLGGSETKVVRDAMEKAKREVQTVMDRLTWWRIVWRVDDIGDTVRTAVDRAWCRDLEDQLIFHGGRLASTQKAFTASAKELVAAYRSPSPFHSPLLENHLDQLQASPSYAVRPSSLTTPIHTRRAQMSPPTAMLHAAAQRVTLGMGGSVLSGLGIAWAGWAEQLGIIGGALGTGMQAETAMGAGALIAALGVRVMVGSWDKARKRWWRDWDRVGEGLERDLKTTLDHVVANQVTLVSREASTGLTQVVNKRKDEIGGLVEEIEALAEEFAPPEVEDKAS